MNNDDNNIINNNNNTIIRKHICDQNHEKWYEYIYYPYYKDSTHNSKHMFDIYTLTHVFWSAVLMYIISNMNLIELNTTLSATLSVTAIVSLIITVYFEYHENLPESIKKYRRLEIDSMGKTTYRGDTTINIFGDIIGNVIGIILIVLAMTDIMTIQDVLLILLLIFIYVTNVVGIEYWTDFISFLI